MPRLTLSTLAVTAASVVSVLAIDDPSQQFPQTALADKHFSYPDGIPYQADTDNLLRGTQFGYNRCNSTTEGQDSLCQTSFLNHLDDFCLWAPSKPNSLIADTEGEEVAWCTKPGKGTRLIPPGALTGVQFMRTPDYVQVIGFIDQTKINIANGDSGGELDPHGADLRGNPLGGLVYSNAFKSNNGNNNTYQQVSEWHNFMGGNAFCFKACDPAGPHPADYCQHIYDRIGCAYNAPNAAQDGVFEACEGDSQDFPGVYTGADGKVTTYQQPPESLGAISTMPYQPKVPASSNCVPFQSAQLYASVASVFPSSLLTTSSAPTSTPTSGVSTSKSSTSGSTSRSTSSAGPSATANSASMARARVGSDNGAAAAAVIGLMGMLFSVVLLA